MKAGELRIGNYILYGETHTVFQVLTINEDGYTVKNDSEETWIEQWAFYSIPITKEWLVKFGFTKTHGRDEFKKGWFRIVRTISHYTRNPLSGQLDEHLSFVDLDVFHDVEPVRIHIKYVHQLQNLYFALTGEELTIKEAAI